MKNFKEKPLKEFKRTPQLISKEQSILLELFGNRELWGTGNNLPVINHTLTSGYGLIKTGSGNQTAKFFGLRKKKEIEWQKGKT